MPRMCSCAGLFHDSSGKLLIYSFSVISILTGENVKFSPVFYTAFSKVTFVSDKQFSTRTVDFLGLVEDTMGYQRAQGYLDIDLENTLQCTEGREYCDGKYFQFDAYCMSVGCAIKANSLKNIYELMYVKNASTGETAYVCQTYSDSPSLAKDLCKSMQAQGWIWRGY